MAGGTSPRDIAVDTVVAGTASLIGLIKPDLLVGAAAAGPLASSAVGGAVEWVSTRRRRNQEYVFDFAAREAGLSLDELKRRCEQNPDLEDLLLLVLDAAADTARPEKLIAYYLALASGASMPDDEDRWQSALVRVLRDLGSEHLTLLDRFTQTSNELGLGDGSEDFDFMPEVLNEGQVEIITGDIPALPSALATLQRHGLLANASYTPGPLGGGGRPIVQWKLTDFGAQVLALLREIGNQLRASDPAG